MHPYAPISTRTQRDPDGAVNRHRQHKAAIVVGVFANQIHAPRCADDDVRHAAKTRLKGCGYFLLEHLAACFARG